MMVRLAAMTLAWVSAAPRGVKSIAAVEITANTSSSPTVDGSGAGPSRYSAAKALKPAAGVSPS